MINETVAKILADLAAPHPRTDLCSSRLSLEALRRLGFGLSIGLGFRVRVNINFILFVLHFIHLHSVDGAKVVSKDL